MGTLYLSSSDAEIANSSFSDSFANDEGGTIYSSGGELSISDTSIDETHAADKGGAIYSLNGEAVLSGVTISNGSAPGAAGLYVDDSEVIISDSTFDTNQATSGCGGDIRINSSVSIYLVEVTDSSFSGSYPDTVCLNSPNPDLQYTYTGTAETFSCSPTACE